VQTGEGPPTTYDIAGTVYQVNPDKDNMMWVNDAQHVAVTTISAPSFLC
jgi:hypothetical protein